MHKLIERALEGYHAPVDATVWWEGLAMVAFCALVPFLGAVL